MKSLKMAVCAALLTLAMPMSAQKKVMNTFRVGVGPSILTADVYDGYHSSNRSEGGVEFQGEYTCLFRVGSHWRLGFGVLGAYNETEFSGSKMNQFVISPEFAVSALSKNEKWRLNMATGIGLASMGGDFKNVYEDAGANFHVSVGGEYMITQKVGIGLDFMNNGTGYKQKNNDDVVSMNRIAFLGSLRIHL